MAVHLTRIYTRTGDKGETGLADFSRVPKTDSRLEAYADCDEANAVLGIALTHEGLPADVVEVIRQIQNDLFDAGADLSTPNKEDLGWEPLRITEEYITRLEGWCDTYNEQLEPLNSFILPGGTPVAATLHLARTVARRAERRAWAAVQEHDDEVSTLPAAYLNRLSDLLFILSRLANQGQDVLWVPGGKKQDDPTPEDSTTAE